MRDVMLVHWKAQEIPERIARLKKAGFRTIPFSAGGAELRRFNDTLPAAFVIDLARIPSHGLAVATALRQKKGTRHVPLVFVGGDYDKVAKVRRQLPDAIYTDWKNIAAAMKKASAWRNEKPIVPGTMDAYSKTPLPKKLGVDGDRTVILLHAPKGFENLIRAGDGTPRIRRGDRGQADVVIWFVKSASELKERLPLVEKAMADGGGLWIAWPKKTSGVKTDLSEPVVRKTGLAAGLVDYKICAIDDTWSGLKFARRSNGKKPAAKK